MRAPMTLPRRWAILLLCSMILPVVIMNSCRKMESTFIPDQQNISKFFALPANSSDALISVADDIRRQNDQYHFIGGFSKKYGFPVWDKVAASVPLVKKQTGNNNDPRASINTDVPDAHPLFFIPMKIPGGSISAYLAVYKKDSGYSYKLHARPKLENAVATITDADSLKTAMTELLVIGYFEQQVNNIDTIHLAGKDYTGITVDMHGGNAITNTVSNVGPGGYWETEVVTTCYKVIASQMKSHSDHSGIISVVPGSGGAGGNTVCYDQLRTVWVSFGGGGGNGGNAGGGSNTSGGSGGFGGGNSGGNVTCPYTNWWCELGEYRILDNRLVTPDNYPCKQYKLAWLWWENDLWQNNNYHIVQRLATELSLTNEQVSWAYNHPEEAAIFNTILDENDAGDDGIVAAKITMEMYTSGVQTSPTVLPIQKIYLRNLSAAQQNLVTDPMFLFYLRMEAAFIKVEHPEYSSLRCWWEASKEYIHGALDMAGMVPLFGEVADLTNGIIYTIEGNGTDAALSFAATIPIAGWAATTAKYARKTIYALDGTRRTLKWFKAAGDVISFGDRNLLRKVLGLAVGDARQAHHIIPWDLAENKLIQRLAKSKNAFHLNERYNGMALETIQHLGSHQAYTTRVTNELEKIERKGLSDDDAFREVKDLIERIRSAIEANPTKDIDDIIF